MRTRYSTIGFAVISIFVAACTPQMPPEVAAELADRYINCVPGSVSLVADSSMGDAVSQWVSDTQTSCAQMQVTSVDATTPADLYVGSSSSVPASCTIAAQVPVAFDAVVPVVYSDNFDTVVLTPTVLKKAFTGEITSWDDPAIVALNADAELPAEPIVISGGVSNDPVQLAFSNWMSRIDPADWTPTDTFTSVAPIAADEMPNTSGLLALVPNQVASDQGLSVIGLITDDSPDGFVPDDPNFASAATQLVATNDQDVVMAQIDASVAPSAIDGVSEVPVPWQAITPLVATVCTGANELPARALARNMVRLNAQGQLQSLGLQSMPEAVRSLSSAALGTGLPAPTTTPNSEATSGPTPENTPTS